MGGKLPKMTVKGQVQWTHPAAAKNGGKGQAGRKQRERDPSKGRMKELATKNNARQVEEVTY